MKHIIFLIYSLLLSINVYGMEPLKQHIGIPAEVETYFIPFEKKAANQKLMNLLDNTKKRVFVAVYWITDDPIIDKLISLKRKGIDVQVIFDESVSGIEGFISKFSRNNIIPIVFPSHKVGGIMHNKFLIIDDLVTLTGSANFTKTALNPASASTNYENFIILHSSAIAEKFIDTFFKIKIDIFKAYIKFIAENRAPRWILKLSKQLYEKDPDFRRQLRGQYNEYNPEQQNQLKEFFPKESFPIISSRKRLRDS